MKKFLNLCTGVFAANIPFLGPTYSRCLHTLSNSLTHLKTGRGRFASGPCTCPHKKRKKEFKKKTFKLV